MQHEFHRTVKTLLIIHKACILYVIILLHHMHMQNNDLYMSVDEHEAALKQPNMASGFWQNQWLGYFQKPHSYKRDLTKTVI